MAESGFTSRVTARHLRKEQVQIDFRMSRFLCDHPPELGGDDEGPTPSEFLLAAVACSMAQHAGRHAARLNIPLESIEITTDFEVGMEKGDGPLDPLAFLSKVKARVEMRGDLTPGQLETMRHIIENCAVVNSLRRGIQPEIETALVRPGGAGG